METNPLKIFVLKLITKIQKLLLRSKLKIATNAYYALAKIHFKIHFGLDLSEQVLNDTDFARKAAKRHSVLVSNTLYKDANESTKRMIKSAAKGTFIKNLILSAKL